MAYYANTLRGVLIAVAPALAARLGTALAGLAAIYGLEEAHISEVIAALGVIGGFSLDLLVSYLRQR